MATGRTVMRPLITVEQRSAQREEKCIRKTMNFLGKYFMIKRSAADAEIAAAGLFDLRLVRNDVKSSYKMDASAETLVDYLPWDLFFFF